MLYNLFLKYWKLSTWYTKPIGPYYRWLWRSPGKKFFLMLVISSISITIQFNLIERLALYLEEKNKKVVLTTSNAES